MSIAIAVVLALAGLCLLVLIFRMLQGLGSRLEQAAEAPPQRAPHRPRAEGIVTSDQLVYLFAHEFVKPAPKRPMGTIVRDRVFACQAEVELDAEDFAEQLLYATLSELQMEHCLDMQVISREPSYMPPYPHKQWELQIRQSQPFPSSPLGDSLGMGFALARKNRLRLKRDVEELAAEDQFFALEEILERALKSIRQEMSFWERGTICSDLRNYVETALVAEELLIEPERETWLDKVRSKRPTPNEQALAALVSEMNALKRRLETFRKLYGSSHAINPQQNAKGELVDIDPAVISARAESLSDLPLDDVLRATIHEAIVAIRQLEPSGEAGI